jgi:ribonucleoside-diphosphate reductase alpha chain
MSLIQVKESKGSSLVQVVPEYQKYHNRYQLMWEQKDCIEYLKTAAVINAFCDQSISTNTFYSPRNYEGGKVPATTVAYNLMMSHYWGIKTFYYSLMEKTGAKAETEEFETVSQITNVIEDDEHCESCVL